MSANDAAEPRRRVIDIHAHVVLAEAFGVAGPYGPEVGEDDGTPFFRVGRYVMKPMDYRGTLFMDVEKRLRAMDRGPCQVFRLCSLRFCS